MLIVMEHKIMAVVANQETKAELKVIACIQLEDRTPPTGKDEPECTTPSLAQCILKHWSWTFVISKNMSKDRQTLNTLPTLNDPELSDSLESSCSESELMEYINKRLWVCCNGITTVLANVTHNRSGTAFSSHLWIISRLLTQKSPIVNLLPYCIAASCKKIYRCLVHENHSAPYATSLRKYDMANFVFKPLREGSIISSGEEAYDKKLLCSLRGVIPQHKLDTFEELNVVFKG